MAVLVGGLHRAMVPLMRLALALTFRRIRVLHPERMPREGAVLLVANHPSTWTDVVLLDVVLGRRFHFLAHGEQFHPWPRGILLHIYGTLPIWSHQHTPDARTRNAATFHRCERLFDRAEGVAIFPEGISRVDRGMLPLKHGAAQLALSYAARRHERPFALVPVGIHYSNRAAFRGNITVSVGKPISTAALRAFGIDHPEDGACRLTDLMGREMRGLVLKDMARFVAELFAVLEPLAAGSAGSLELEPARLLARSLADEMQDHPEEFARLARHSRSFERMRAALGVSGLALASRSRAQRVRDGVALVVGAAPALAGFLIHALPAILTHAATRRYAAEPSQVAFARIASGFLFFALFYASGTALLLLGTPVRPAWILALVPVSCLLALFAHGYGRRARLEYQRWRVAWISRRHGRFVRSARREREALSMQAAALRT